MAKNTKNKKTKNEDDSINAAINPFGRTYELLKKNWKTDLKRMLKISTFTVGISVLYIILLFTSIIVAGILGVFATDANPVILFAVVALAAIMTVVYLIVYYSAEFVSYNSAAQNCEGKKYAGIVENLKLNLMPTAKYIIANLIIWAVLSIPLLIIAILIFGADLSGFRENTSPAFFAKFFILMLLVVAYLFVAILSYSIFSQFWLWELIVARKGAVESLKESMKLVKGNILKIIVFDILYVIAAVIVAIPFAGISFVLEMIFQVGSLVGSLAGGVAMVLVVVAYLIFSLGIGIIKLAVDFTIFRPLVYYFWKNLKKSD